MEKANHSVVALCRVLGVTRQGYYAYASRGVSERVQDEQRLVAEVRAVHESSVGRYGSPRVHAALRRRGRHVSRRRIERVMRGLGLSARPRKRTRATTRQNPEHQKAGNVLDRAFTASRPNERWVTDITYIWTAEGWSYLSAIVDLYSRAVVGWALSASLSTDLALQSLRNAVLRRRPLLPLLHHSDRGCQYTSEDYRKELAKESIDVSMSRTGNCWDNAPSESFFATLKKELIHRADWATRAELRDAVFRYIDIFYNRQRLHSSLGYRTPAEVEDAYVPDAALDGCQRK